MTNEELESLAKEILDMRDDFYTRLIREPNARQWAIASLEDAARLVRSKIIKKRIKRTVWLNVYEHNIYCEDYKTKEKADDNAMSKRLACVKVEIDCEEGEGL